MITLVQQIDAAGLALPALKRVIGVSSFPRINAGAPALQFWTSLTFCVPPGLISYWAGVAAQEFRGMMSVL